MAEAYISGLSAGFPNTLDAHQGGRLSLTAQDERRISPTIWVGVALALVAGILVSLIVMRESGEAPSRPGATSSHGGSTLPSIRQARWRIHSEVIGRPLPKKRRDNVMRHRARIAAGIKQVYEGLFLDPARLGKSLRGVATSTAARHLIREGAGVPARASRVKTLARKARIWIQPGSFRRAAAKVIVRARATMGERTRRVRHVATLWLERWGSKWKVVAYDFKERPLR
jgi:hypothetical protein